MVKDTFDLSHHTELTNQAKDKIIEGFIDLVRLLELASNRGHHTVKLIEDMSKLARDFADVIEDYSDDKLAMTKSTN